VGVAVPAWVGWASLAASAAGAGYAAYGQHRAGQYQAAVAEQNASLAEKAAVDAENRGRTEEAQHRMKVRSLIGQQKAGYGASGVLVDTGSPLDALADTAYIGEQDALTIRRNAAMEAWGLRTQSGNFRAEGRLSKLQGNYGAGATLLQGAGAAGGQFYGMRG
jgi:hypothetical protein